MINSLKSFYEDNKIDIYYVIILLTILLIISIPRLLSQYIISIGNWDTYLYLENARRFAHMGLGDTSSISPVVPFVVSLAFSLAGHPYEQAIFNIDIIFYIVGVLCLYGLFRFRFKQNVSLVGSVIYATFTLLYSWVAIGGNDIAGVSLTIATIYLIVLSKKVNTKFYYVALPIAAFAFLSRYTAGVMLFAIIFYLLVNKVTKTGFKRFVYSCILGVLCVSPFLFEFYRVLKTPFPFLGQFGGTVSNAQVIDAGYLPDTMYYINNLPTYLSSVIHPKSTFTAVINPSGNIPTILSYMLIFLMIFGFLLLAYRIYSSVKNSEEPFWNKKNILLSCIAIIIFIVMIFTLNTVSYIISLLLFFVVLGIIWYLTSNYNIKDLDYDFLMLSLFVIYLIFQSILSTKNDRYFITVLPFIAFFITLSINWIYSQIDSMNINFKKINLTTILSVVIVCLLLCNSLAFVNEIPENNHFKDVRDSCNWYKEYNPDYNKSVVYSDNWPAVTWYLNIRAVHSVPYSQVNNIEKYPENYSEEILYRNETFSPAGYYIDTNSIKKLDYPGLIKIKKIGDVVIYKNEYVNITGNTRNLSSDYDIFIQNKIINYINSKNITDNNNTTD